MMKKIVFYTASFMCLIIAFRLVAGEPCFVPSNSMEPTIQVGDWLWIDKFTYGGRLPQRASEIPLINVFTWIKPLREMDAAHHWGDWRMPGLRKPRHLDIIVFRDMKNHSKLVVKRLIGLPGDT